VKSTAGVSEKQIAAFTKQLEDSQKAGAKSAEAMKKVNDKIADLQEGTKSLTVAQKSSIAEYVRLGLSVDEISLKMGLSATKVKAYADEWNDLQKLVATVIPRIKADISTLPLSLNPGSATIGTAIPQIPRSSLMAPLVEALERDFAGIDLAAVKASNAIKDFGGNTADQLERAEKEAERRSRAIAGFIDDIAAPFMDIAASIPGLGGMFAQFGVQAASAFAKAAFGAITLQQALQGVALAGYGMLVSLAAESFREDRPVTQLMRDDFARPFGGRQGLELQAQMANVNLSSLDMQTSAAVFETLTAPRVQRAIEAQQQAMERYNITWRDFGIEIRQAQVTLNSSTLFRDFARLTKAGVDSSKVITGMSDDLNQLIIDAVRTGTRIPAALGPMLRTLIETKQISEEAAAALLGIADDGIPALADISAAAERYGLTLDQLGPKVQQLRINDAAKQIAADFKILTDAGADATVVAASMAQKIQDILDISFKTGAEVPIALKPIIQILIDMGLLTDANGDKLNDINDINFGKDLVSAIDLLIERLNDLLDILIDVGDEQDRVNGGRPNLGGNPPSGPAIPRPPGGTTPDPNAPAPSPDPNAPAPIPGARPPLGPSFSTSTSSQPSTSFTGTDALTSSTTSSTATFIMNVDGRTLAEATVPYIPGEVQRFGLA
jgi:hypothetical protein